MADVVDNDELIATRKLNGLDDDLFQKEKAKNKKLRNNYEKKLYNRN